MFWRKKLKENIHEELKRIRPELIKLKEQIRAAQVCENSLVGIENLCRSVAEFQDFEDFSKLKSLCGKNPKKFNFISEQIATLEKHLSGFGRTESGWNQAAQREDVTADKIRLTEVFGVQEQNLTYWQRMYDGVKAREALKASGKQVVAPLLTQSYALDVVLQEVEQKLVDAFNVNESIDWFVAFIRRETSSF